MATSSKGPVLWDRNLDRRGRLIRTDVREAAHEIWEHACRRARVVLGDDNDTAEMMEVSVEGVSHYLDRLGAAPRSENAAALLTTAFRREVYKRRRKRQRLEFIGGANEVDRQFSAPDGFKNVDLELDLKKIVRLLSPRSNTILQLRREGIGWRSISEELGIPEQTAQNSFWREVRQATLSLLETNGGKEETSTNKTEGEQKNQANEPPVPSRRKGRHH
jgi:DNA-binding NarL/FixJ family response regulator